MAFTLKDVVPWGRSYDEYVGMFALSSVDLDKKILGCSDGPASFNYQMARMGRKVLSVDPLFQFSREEISSRIEETFSTVLKQAEENKGEFVWDKISSVSELGEVRRAAMNQFLADFKLGQQEGRYLHGSLPRLDFADKQFDLALCSHFLFLYSSQFSLQFHIDSIHELLRVAAEVRVFPLLELGSKVSRHFEQVFSHFEASGYHPQVIDVAYEFQKGGNQLLMLSAR